MLPMRSTLGLEVVELILVLIIDSVIMKNVGTFEKTERSNVIIRISGRGMPKRLLLTLAYR